VIFALTGLVHSAGTRGYIYKLFPHCHSVDLCKYFLLKNNKCSLHHAKKLFYRSASAIFGEIGRIASEEVVIQLIISKCIPVILYGLEACPLTKSDLLSMDFVINRFFYEIISNK